MRADKPPILAHKVPSAPSVFRPKALLREARRQKGLKSVDVPAICILDPDGDIVRRLRGKGLARRFEDWACYHTVLDTFALGKQAVGIVGCAVGAPFAVLVAEELFASGCRLLVSVTSAGQIDTTRPAPYFFIIERAIRDEGTSYHYAPPSEFADADASLVGRAASALRSRGIDAVTGATWTTDAPFRETEEAIRAARAQGILAVEMEAAALYAFARASGNAVLCVAHVTNSMGQSEGDFEKGTADGTDEALRVLEAMTSDL